MYSLYDVRGWICLPSGGLFLGLHLVHALVLPFLAGAVPVARRVYRIRGAVPTLCSVRHLSPFR